MKYSEQCTFELFEGLEMQKPFSGNEYEVTLSPGEEQLILMKADKGGHSLSMDLDYCMLDADGQPLKAEVSESEDVVDE